MIAIGDSHVTFLERAGLMRSHWTGPLNIVTIYKLLDVGLDLSSLSEQLAVSPHFVNNGVMPWQCPSGKYDVPNIKPGEEVFYSFGFNDVQKNIFKYHRLLPMQEIDNLVTGYVLFVKEHIRAFKIEPAVMAIPPSPAPSETSGKYKHGLCGEFEAHGSDPERWLYTRYMNIMLEHECSKNRIKFVNIYEDLTHDGYFKKEYTEDLVHLRHDNKELIEKVKSKL